MFYSHFILAKKGPLGTVWIAAHLERKLRKNQVTETNISASVDSIMFPEVPIALRLSGHLLLGVVRIYSKKVNYLYQDCSDALAKIKQAFNSVQVDLPPGATSAPFHSITLPETFEFDDMEEELRYGIPDMHVTTRDQITLSHWPQGFDARPHFGPDEQVPGRVDPYTMIYLDEESRIHRSPPRPQFPSPLIPSMEEDVLPPLPMDDTMGLDQMDIEINGLEEAARGLTEEPLHEHIPERETLRSAVGIPQQEPFLIGSEEVERSTEIGDEVEGQRMDDIERPVLEEIPVLGDGTPAFEWGRTPSSRRTPGETPGNEDLLTTALGGMSPALTVMPTPTKSPAPEEKRKRSRKKRPLFDESIVLSNKFMKKQLEDTDDLCRTRTRVLCSKLEIWKAYRNSHIQQSFSEPSLPGMSTDLQEIFKKVFTGQGVRVAFAEPPTTGFREGHEESPKSPQAPEIETTRLAPPEVEAVSPVGFGTPYRMEEPTFQATEEIELEAQMPEVLEPEVIVELGEVRTDEPTDLEFETPSQHGLGEAEQVPLEEVPSVGLSVYEEEGDQGLKFLEEDSRYAASVAAVEQEFNEEPGMGDAAKRRRVDDSTGWSVRTRAVAQYLQAAFQKLDTSQEKLNLGQMLARRTRKESARMFFETLVLKSKDYLEVKQEEPYADILLSPTPKLNKAKF
uniref:Rad21/Rec8-like protein N-terminal domain-containing protein n=1 Tax=Picea sitchensis TaxID=3332 RepID=D5A868_PICSI|nr:unknown [Picea sitchensis]